MEEMGINLNGALFFHIGSGFESFNLTDLNYFVSEIMEVNLFVLKEEISPDLFILRPKETAGFKWVEAKEVLHNFSVKYPEYVTLTDSTLNDYYIPYFNKMIDIMNNVKNKDDSKLKFQVVKQV